jgi:hypothetical protein
MGSPVDDIKNDGCQGVIRFVMTAITRFST